METFRIVQPCQLIQFCGAALWVVLLAAPVSAQHQTDAKSWLGIMVQTSSLMQGAVVRSVTPHGPADRAGVQPGDIVTHFHDTPMTSAEEFIAHVARLPANTVTTLTILRDWRTVHVLPIMSGDPSAQPSAEETRHHYRETLKQPGQQGARLSHCTDRAVAVCEADPHLFRVPSRFWSNAQQFAWQRCIGRETNACIQALLGK